MGILWNVIVGLHPQVDKGTDAYPLGRHRCNKTPTGVVMLRKTQKEKQFQKHLPNSADLKYNKRKRGKFKPKGAEIFLMTIYVCLDDRNGMLFNRRRQSRDAAVLEDIQAGIPGVLIIEAFSEKLIQGAQIPYALAPEDIAALPPEAHFFLETKAAASLVPMASTVVLYRWNRHYPADTHWDIDLAQCGFTLKETREFPGKSHEKITKEVYTR